MYCDRVVPPRLHMAELGSRSWLLAADAPRAAELMSRTPLGLGTYCNCWNMYLCFRFSAFSPIVPASDLQATRR